MSTILGQEHALEILRGALGAGRFHHAWVFSGPRGVGKFTTAIEVARVLLDPESDGQRSGDRGQRSAVDREIVPDRNPHSRVQQLIDAGMHPDLHVVRKEDVLYSSNRALRERKQINIPIDLLRERVIGGMSGDVHHDAAAYRKAALGHSKVFIIDEAELLDETGQNALLKTLEEPPPETYFFLITSQPDELLPTIRSRCQHVRFGPLNENVMHQWMRSTGGPMLESRLMRPDPGTDEPPARSKAAHRDAILAWIEEFADGAPGIAHLAIEYGFFDWQARLEPMLNDLARGVFPVTMGESLNAIVQEFADAWVKNHKNASKDAANQDGARYVFALLGSFARRQLAESVAVTKRASPDWPAVIDLLRDAERDLDAHVNLRMLMENLAAQWGQCATLGANAAERAPAR